MTQPSAGNGGSWTMAVYPTPRDLVSALQAGEAKARTRFTELLRDPLLKLLTQLTREHPRAAPPTMLVERALRLAEVHARAHATRNISWRAFLGELLFQVGRVLAQPPSEERAPVEQESLPECHAYVSETYVRPYEAVGGERFGGDWFIGQHDADGTLWVLMADITGHGYHAYLLASTLPHLWRVAWERATTHERPADVLAALHEQLAGVMPEGIYVEGTLLKMQPSGEVIVQPAGGTRLLLRRQGAARPELLTYRGFWLGLMPPSPDDQRQFRLLPGDELIVGTDGLYDQLDGHAGRDLDAHLGAGSSEGLFEWITGLVRASLAAGPQKDDITLLLLRRRPALRAARDGSATRAADVPV